MHSEVSNKLIVERGQLLAVSHGRGNRLKGNHWILRQTHQLHQLTVGCLLLYLSATVLHFWYTVLVPIAVTMAVGNWSTFKSYFVLGSLPTQSTI